MCRWHCIGLAKTLPGLSLLFIADLKVVNDTPLIFSNPFSLLPKLAMLILKSAQCFQLFHPPWPSYFHRMWHDDRGTSTSTHSVVVTRSKRLHWFHISFGEQICFNATPNAIVIWDSICLSFANHSSFVLLWLICDWFPFSILGYNKWFYVRSESLCVFADIFRFIFFLLGHLSKGH